MNTQLIPVFAGELSGLPVQLVDARLLHSFLEVANHFREWIKDRISDYGFQENQDFLSFAEKSAKPKGGRPSIEYHVSLDMAKELSMVERNEKGKQARRYFIDCERRLLQAKPQTIENIRTRLLISIENGETHQQVVPFDACVVSGSNAQQLSTFLRECVPFELVPVVLESATQRLLVSHQANINTLQQQPAQQITTPIAKAPTIPLSLSGQFADDWRKQNTAVINAPFAPCLGTQALRLFHVWAQNKGVAMRLGDNRIMSDLYQQPDLYSKQVRISKSSNSNPRTVLMIDDVAPPAGIVSTD